MPSPTRLPPTSMGLDADWISRVWSLGGSVHSPAGGLFLFDNEDGTYDIVRRRVSEEDLDDETVESGLTEEQAARRYSEGGLPRSNGRGHRKLLRSLRTNAPPRPSMQDRDLADLDEERASRVRNVEDEYRLPNLSQVVPASYLRGIPWRSRTVTIYRAVNREDPSKTIVSGDWVALARSYAEEHAQARGPGSRVLQMTVPAKDVAWAGTDMNEFFYVPAPLSSVGKRENARHNAPPPNPFRGSDRERQLVSLHMLAVQINELQVRNQQDYTQEVADLLEELEALHNQIVQKLGLEETQHEMHYQVYDEHYDIGAWLAWGRALLYDKVGIRGNGGRASRKRTPPEHVARAARNSSYVLLSWEEPDADGFTPVKLRAASGTGLTALVTAAGSLVCERPDFGSR